MRRFWVSFELDEEHYTKAEASRATGLSIRTLERLAADRKIEQKRRRVPGRKPLTVINPNDVERLKQETLGPVPFLSPQEPGETKAVTVRPQQRELAALAGLSATLQQAMQQTSVVPLDRKLFLTVTEASKYSGLPAAHIRRLIAEGRLDALKIGGWRIRRSALESL